MVERFDFESRRRVFEALVGRVAMRLLGRTEALRRSATNFSRAVARFRSWERCSCAVTISIPSWDSCRPAMVSKPLLHLMGQDGIGHVITQFHRGGDFVHILSTGPGGADEGFGDIPLIYAYGIRDSDHDFWFKRLSG